MHRELSGAPADRGPEVRGRRAGARGPCCAGDRPLEALAVNRVKYVPADATARSLSGAFLVLDVTQSRKLVGTPLFKLVKQLRRPPGCEADILAGRRGCGRLSPLPPPPPPAGSHPHPPPTGPR